MVVEDRWLRDTYVDLLLEYAAKDERIVLVEADLARAAGTLRFREQYPERMVDVGVAEANMVGVAAGMAAMGKIPFAHTFTPFMSRRACDQVTLSVAYTGLNVRLVGSDPGITAELNGGTHMSMEDIAIMRSIPGMVVFEPTDSTQLREAFPHLLKYQGPIYIRLLRRNAAKVFRECTGDFQLGKGVLLREGKDITLVASGIMTAETLDAADLLEKEGISAEVINIHTVKPLDEELILRSARKTCAVVTAENGSILNGLGSAVAECLSEKEPTILKRVGVQDSFGEVGLTDYLKERFGLTASAVADAARECIMRKARK